MFNLFKSQKSDHYLSVDTDDDYIIEGDNVGRRRFIKQTTNVDIITTLNRANVPMDECFNAYVFGETEDLVSGSMLVFDSKNPFRPLSAFGLDFLNHFEGTTVNSPLLETLSIIDVPNVMRKDSIEIDGHTADIDRYDLTPAFDWFCQQAERIFLFLDANIITISDANRQLMEKYSHKVVVVLDNTDMNTQKLIKAYGMLMFMLAKIVRSPSQEAIRVHVGPLNIYRLKYPLNGKLFQAARKDFFKDLESIHKYAASGQLSKLLERARLAKIHAFTINELFDEMKSVWRKERKKLELCKNLQTIYNKVRCLHNLSSEDFPDLAKMQM